MKYFQMDAKEVAVSLYDWDRAGNNAILLIKIPR